MGLNAWTDAALLQSAGTPTVMFGPLGGNFHSPHEWVSLPEVVTTVDLVTAAASETPRVTTSLLSDAAAATRDWLAPLLEQARRFYPVPGGVVSIAGPDGRSGRWRSARTSPVSP